MSVSYGGDSITFADGSVQSGAWNGFRNRIINGAMVIDQRNAGASGTANNATYFVDRFRFNASQSGKFTFQQNLNSVTLPSGFTNYLGLTTASAVSVGAGDYFSVDQRIEGYNIADLSWGTSSAKTVTLSFQVYSSLTGTFGGALQNSARNRSYPFSYSIPVANTWTSISITISGDTTGTWLTTNGIGIFVNFGLGYGSTYGGGTAGAWVSGDVESVTGAVSVVGTLNATFYITGVQLERGSTASSFEYRPYGTELALCQRYYVQSASAGNNGQFWDIAGRFTGTTQCFFNVSLPVSMRAQPSISITPAYNFGGGWYSNLAGVANYAWTAAPVAGTSYCFNVCNFYVSMSTVSAGTVGLWADPYCPTTAAANYFAISAEL